MFRECIIFVRWGMFNIDVLSNYTTSYMQEINLEILRDNCDEDFVSDTVSFWARIQKEIVQVKRI